MLLSIHPVSLSLLNSERSRIPSVPLLSPALSSEYVLCPMPARKSHSSP